MSAVGGGDDDTVGSCPEDAGEMVNSNDVTCVRNGSDGLKDMVGTHMNSGGSNIDDTGVSAKNEDDENSNSEYDETLGDQRAVSLRPVKSRLAHR
jgi:hypothetical protein